MTKSTENDLRSNPEVVEVIEVPWKAIHSNAEQILLDKMLLERKYVSDFEQVLKEIDFRNSDVLRCRPKAQVW